MVKKRQPNEAAVKAFAAPKTTSSNAAPDTTDTKKAAPTQASSNTTEKFVLRLGPEMYAQIKAEAWEKQMSMNQYIILKLSS